MFDCKNNSKNGLSKEQAELVARMPMLRYLKEPVGKMSDLYARYPDGGEFGWFALVLSEKNIAYWDVEERKWILLGSDIKNFYAALIQKIEQIKNFSIKKTYKTKRDMEDDVEHPIANNGGSLLEGEFVVVTNSAEPIENGIYQYQGDKWLFISKLGSFEDYAKHGGSTMTLKDVEDKIFFTKDINVILNDGKRIGKYKNGDVIPAKGKTAYEVLKDISQEYLFPKVSSFTINKPTVLGIGSVLDGKISFSISIQNNENVKAGSVSVMALGETNDKDFLVENGIQNYSFDKTPLRPLVYGDKVFLLRFQNTQNEWIEYTLPLFWKGLIYHSSRGIFEGYDDDENVIFEDDSEHYLDSTTQFPIFLDQEGYQITLLRGYNIESIVTENDENITNLFEMKQTIERVGNDGMQYDYDIYYFQSAVPLKVGANVIIKEE